MKPEDFKDLVYFVIIIIGIAITFGGIGLLEGSKLLTQIKQWFTHIFNKHRLYVILLVLIVVIWIFFIVRLF